jgi:hypothetical protein
MTFNFRRVLNFGRRASAPGRHRRPRVPRSLASIMDRPSDLGAAGLPTLHATATCLAGGYEVTAGLNDSAMPTHES